MEMTGMNWWAVIVSAIAYMVVGALWYSPALFGNAWMKGIGRTKEQVAADFSPLNYLWTLIFSFIAAYGIARICLWTSCQSVWDGIVIGLMAGVCFVLPTMGVNDLFEARKRSLTVMNILFHLVAFVVIGVIIGA